MIDTLPPRELDRVEVERLREQDDVVALSGLGSHDAERTNGLLIGLQSEKIVALRFTGREQGWVLVDHGDLRVDADVTAVVESLFQTTSAPPDARQDAIDSFVENAIEWRDYL